MGTRVTPADALLSAIKIVGDQVRFGALCGVTQSAVSKWVAKGDGLPAEHAIKVEKATKVSRHDLRPDIYPRDSASAPSLAADLGGLEPAR